MNLFKAFSGKSEPEAVAAPVAASAEPPRDPDAIDTSALIKPAPKAENVLPPIEFVDGKPIFTTPETPELTVIRDEVVKAIKTCFDPEIPVNIYELGLIYDILVNPLAPDTAEVVVRMTLTSPNCPAAVTLPGEVQFKAGQIAGVTASRVNLEWEPSWSPALMSEASKLQLGML